MNSTPGSTLTRTQMLCSLFAALALTACGGGGGGADAIDPPQAGAPAPAPSTGTPTPAPPSQPPAPSPGAAGLACDKDAITCVEVSSASAQSSVPVTFGQPFRAGDWRTTQGLVARDASGNTVPLQTDEVSTHVDGSVRFAVLSAQVPNLAANTPRIINFFTATKTSPSVSLPATPNWNLQVKATLSDGTVLVANPQAQLQQAIANGTNRRLHGPVASEFTVVAPMVDQASGTPHPHLTARLHTRLYEGGSRIRTDVVMENNWTFKANPSNLTYSLSVSANGQTLLSQPSFTHYHHARWHKVVWNGSSAAPQYRLRHHMPYFLASRATWNYDLNVSVPETVLAQEASRLAAANTKPMGAAFLNTYFPATGGRPEIGPLPRWSALYLLSQDDRARASMLANADAAAGVPVHYRNENNDQPLDVISYPNVSVRFGSSTPKLPTPSGSTPWTPDTAHQGSFAYLPYLVTGDAFYLDETMFWAAWNIAGVDPYYRKNGSGLVRWNEIRAQAWAMRSIWEAKASLPDNHPMKAYFTQILANNLADWASFYRAGNPESSPLGAITSELSGATYNGHEAPPWQNDFVAMVLSLMAENGEPQAKTVLDWLSTFTMGRFNKEAEGFCPIKGASYYLKTKNSSGQFISTWSQFYAANYTPTTNCSSVPFDEMAYPDCADCYAAVARAMMGASANAGVSLATTTYSRWKALTPKLEPAYPSNPSFAIVPR